MLDWDRRHLTMRTHTALHILCGVIWSEFGLAVTGGNMDPGKGRLDFPFESMSTELGQRVERRINEEIDAAREILVDFVGREVADEDAALIRTSANLIPREIDPLRVIDIVGLDKQADGGTHVLSTAEVGRVAVTGTESKGKGNKRIRIEVARPQLVETLISTARPAQSAARPKDGRQGSKPSTAMPAEPPLRSHCSRLIRRCTMSSTVLCSPSSRRCRSIPLST